MRLEPRLVGSNVGIGAKVVGRREEAVVVLTKATAWLVVLFFASSFGLALIVNQKAAVTDGLDLELPPAEIMEDVPAVDEELPQVDDAEPAFSGDDLPELD